MFTIIETNAAAILTIIILWSMLAWLVTYWVMFMRFRNRESEFGDTIDFMNEYCDELHAHIQTLKAELDSVNAPVSYVLTDKGIFAREEN
jgi:hypothetical protein